MLLAAHMYQSVTVTWCTLCSSHECYVVLLFPARPSGSSPVPDHADAVTGLYIHEHATKQASHALQQHSAPSGSPVPQCDDSVGELAVMVIGVVARKAKIRNLQRASPAKHTAQ
jgi:hypothetical protein